MSPLPQPLAGSLVVDGHTDLPSRLFERPADLSERLPDGHIDLPRLRAGGVSALVAALYVPADLSPEAGWERALGLHGTMAGQWQPGELEKVTSADDVRSAAERGAVGALLALENGRPLQLPGTLARCAALGIRYVTLTHNATHEWCDAAMDEPRHGGLSDVGVKIVREMRRRGILVDVSHVSDDAVLNALDAVRMPVIASHSSSRALCNHPRNLSDSLAADVARAGGVVMANAVPFLLDAAAAKVQRRCSEELEKRRGELPSPEDGSYSDAREQLIEEIAERHPMPKVPLSRYVDHVMHLVGVAGEEHVGIGSDFDGMRETPVGFGDCSRYPALVEALLERGLSAPAVRMVLGENFLRVLAESERLST
ncbi:MAG TPA: dipeptidase [Thermoanaerobaculia bacterium]|nr:dipeptidase [Thermoanaerobaculia bacterium]